MRGKKQPARPNSQNYFLRWRILARMRRFLRPILRRPFPVFLVPTRESPDLIGGYRLLKSNGRRQGVGPRPEV